MPIPETVAEAARSLADGGALRSLTYRKAQLMADRTLTHPDVIRFANRFVLAAAEYDIPLVPVEFDRELMADRARARDAPEWDSDGWFPSAHTRGAAVDVAHLVRGKELSDKEWRFLAALGRETARRLNVPMEWGGIRIPDHWSLAGWHELPPRL